MKSTRNTVTQNYYVTKKLVGGKQKWYARFVKRDGTLTGHRSVELLYQTMEGRKDTPPIKTKSRAEQVCKLALDRNMVELGADTSIASVFIEQFWDFDGDRIRRLNARKPDSVHRDYADMMKSNFTTHAKPLLPKHLGLSQMKAHHIEAVVNRLIDEGKLANATISKIQMSMTIPLRYAYKKDLIQFDPTKNVEGLDTKPKRIRGVFTPNELKSLLSILHKGDNIHAYLATALSAATAMRLGEILALKASNIALVNEQDALVTVDEAFAKKQHYKVPKGKRVRYVPLARPIAEALLAHAKLNTNGNDLVFWSKITSEHPVSASYIGEAFKEAVAIMLEREYKCVGKLVQDGDKVDKKGEPIMILQGEVIRRERNLVFHSLRHFFVTSARGKVNDTLLRLAVGHTQESVTDGYTHEDYESVKGVADVVRNFVELPS